MASKGRHVASEGTRRCASADDSATPANEGKSWPHAAALSSSIHRGFKFDRIYESDGLTPEAIMRLDQMALMSMKTQDVPKPLMDKIVKLLREFGRKKDLERYGRYLLKRTRSRTSAETPSVLSSWFLPEHVNEETGPIGRLKKNPAFKDIFDHAGAISLDDASMSRLAKANAEDRRHKLYQMFWSPEASLTYLAHRYPAAWATNMRVLYELARRAPDFRPQSVLDYAAGPAPGLAAASEVWPGAFSSAVAVEPSEHMAQIGKFLVADQALPEVRWQRCLYDATDKFDLIIASYIQMEVRGQQSRDALVKQLWGRLTPGGVLVLLEQGSPTGFRFMHHTRELLISRIGPEKFHFVAPCPHEGMCPVAITGKDWCHFAQRVRRTPHKVYNKGAKRRFMEEVKYSYLCIRKGPGPRQRYRTEKQAPTAVEKSYFWPRILWPVIKAGGHTLIDICSAPQNYERLSVSKSKAHSFGYRFSRKAFWGDLWRYPKRLARPEARAYIPEKTRESLDRMAKVAWKALKWEEQEPGFSKEKEREKQFYGH